MTKYLDNTFDPNRLLNTFDELPFWSAPFGLKLLDNIDYKKNISVLDIGFGSGFPLTEIAMRLGDSCTIYGIDPWAEAIERTRLKLDYYNINNVNLIEGVAENIPLKDDSLDLITSNNGINNVADIEQVISECSRIMKPGGQFIQTMNLDKTMFEFYNVMKDVLIELKLYEEIEDMHKHIAVKRPSIDLFTEIMQECGFIIKSIEYDQFNYKFVDGTTLLSHYFIRMAFMDSWIALLPQNKIKEIFSQIENALNKQADILGGIKLSVPYVLIDAIKK
ncbi:MAG: class I SAM-dependent methyltransferase [Prevotella sp.]|jgi:ubiquinone/menaquinone biosynthesis C-methylase UbiE|nr:class I SAM-dependent methyltransferase [Prevotella sp.]